jgi:hypothetical protein
MAQVGNPHCSLDKQEGSRRQSGSPRM